MIKIINYLFVTCFGIGTLRFAPGTITSLVTTIFLYSLFHIINLSSNTILIILLLVFVYSFYAVSEYIKSSDPSADLISKDGTRIQIKANRPTEWIITDNDPGVDLNDWNKLVDTMSKAYGNILREQGSKRVKKDDIRIMTLKEVMDEAIPDNFKEDLDSMSATAISGSYKRTLNKVRESINALQDDLLKVATYEHVYLKKQLGEHLHEKLFSKPNQAEVSVIQDALKDYDFKVDKYLDQRWNRIKAMDDLGSVLKNMESSFLYGKKEEVKNARK